MSQNKPSDADVDAMLAEVTRSIDRGERRFSRMTYAHGIAAAIRWLRGYDERPDVEGEIPRPFPSPTANLAKLADDEVERMVDLYASAPLARVPEVDDRLWTKGWVRAYDGAPGDDAVEPSLAAYGQASEDDPARGVLYLSNGGVDPHWREVQS